MTPVVICVHCVAAAEEDYSDCDCFGVAVSTYGDSSVLCGVDNFINVDTFIQPIKECRSLTGKPKIFILEVCRSNVPLG